MPPAPLSQLKSEAAALASQIGTVTSRARAASETHLGTAGRRRTGVGETFWQYRRHRSEDGASRVDWRRSARESNLFVRETELETARTFLFWVDPSEGFAWSGDAARPDKADRGVVLAMALADVLARGGERCGVLGGARGPATGAKAPSRVGEDLRELKPGAVLPAPPREHCALVIISDFYAPMEGWTRGLNALARKSRDAVLIAVSDPIEEQYPFGGRVRFFRPGEERQRLVGRAEILRDGYLDRFAKRRADMTALAASLGWRCTTHSTVDDPRPLLGRLAADFAAEGARS
ncbi:DUF58 domain-containing protein [bacterium]|nr:DUF58 domain-containing protein [bacterium]